MLSTARIPRSWSPLITRLGALWLALSIPLAAFGIDPDDFEDDDIPSRATVIPLGNFDGFDGAISKNHSIHDAGDEDWFRFASAPDLTITFDAEVQSGGDIVLRVFKAPNFNDPVAEESPGTNVSLEWFEPSDESGERFLQITGTAGTQYELVGSFTPQYEGFVEGRILDAQNCLPVPGAVVLITAAIPSGGQAFNVTMSLSVPPKVGFYRLKYDAGATADVKIDAESLGFDLRSVSGIEFKVSGETDMDIDIVPTGAAAPPNNDDDHLRDTCDPDDDNDDVLDGEDAFPFDPAASVDTDEDGKPDDYNANATQEQRDTSPLIIDTDDDDDGVADVLDNCRLVPNAEQADRNQDGTGDACDSVDDSMFCFPIVTPSQDVVMICL